MEAVVPALARISARIFNKKLRLPKEAELGRA
jgi:hypothetical protein